MIGLRDRFRLRIRQISQEKPEKDEHMPSACQIRPINVANHH